MQRLHAIIAVAGVAVAAALGLVLRLDDALTNAVVPAEDPYNHMALVRDHVRDGRLSGLFEGSALYPPGMHAFLATAWVFSGQDLYDLVLYGPAILGALGIIGVGLLLRTDGAVAMVVGALAYAVAPEAIFRTTMMAPTALDLALLPFFLYAAIELVRGRLAWAGIAAPMAVFFTFAHPWLLAVLGAAGLAFLLLAVLFPWRARGPPLSALGALSAMVVVGVAAGLAVTGCGGYCGPGILRLTSEHTQGTGLVGSAPSLGLLIIALSLLPVVAMVLAPNHVEALAKRWTATPRRPWWTAVAGGAALLVVLLAISIPAFEAGLPEQVDLVAMFGWPLLLLAGAGLLALPLLASRAGHAGAALAAATYPFVVHNPLASPYWPHRTAVFLGIGLVLLAGALAGGLARATSRAAARLAPRTATTRAWQATAVLLIAPLGGVVVAETPPHHHWYRLFIDCEIDAFRDLAAGLEPDDVVVTASWQSKLAIAGLADNATRIWYSEGVLRAENHATHQWIAHGGRTVYAVVESHAREKDHLHVEAIEQEPWQHVWSRCEDEHRVAVHRIPAGIAPPS